MKTHTLSILFLALVTLLASSCTKQEEIQAKKGLFSLGFQDNGLKSDANLTDIYVTIEDEKGDLVYNMYKIPLLRTISSGYLTESIRLDAGDYIITGFIVVSGQDIMYLTPKQESKKAYLVTKPLPIEFKIADGKTTRVVPEVVKAEGGIIPEEYGYASFSFTIVDETIDPEYYLAGTWEMCIEKINVDPNGPMVQGKCFSAEIIQYGNTIILHSPDAGIKSEGNIIGDLIYFNNEVIQHLVYRIVDETTIVYFDDECAGCPAVTLQKIEIDPLNCYNFWYDGADLNYAELVVYALGEKEIARIKLTYGQNTIEFENLYDYYTVHVISPVVDCFRYDFYTIYNYELEKFSCKTDNSYKVGVCGGNSLKLENIDIVKDSLRQF